MKAEFTDAGSLVIIAKNHTEAYALEQWQKENLNPCTLQFKDDHQYCLLFDTVIKKFTLFQRIKFKIQYFLYR